MQSLQTTKTPFFPELDRMGWKAIPHEDDDYNPQYEWYRIEPKSEHWKLEEYSYGFLLYWGEDSQLLEILFRCDVDQDLLHCSASVYIIAKCGDGIIEYLFDPESDLCKEFEHGWCVYYPNLNGFLEDTPYFPSSKLCCSLDKLKIYGASQYIPYYVIREYGINDYEWIKEPPEPNLWLELTFLFNTYKLYYCEKKNNKVECKVTCNGELKATWKWEKGKHGLAKKFFEYVGFSTQDYKHPKTHPI